MMLIGWGVRSLDNLEPDVLFCCEKPHFHGEQKNNQLFHVFLLNLSNGYPFKQDSLDALAIE